VADIGTAILSVGRLATGTGRPSSAHARTVESSSAASSTQQDRSRPERAVRRASPRALCFSHDLQRGLRLRELALGDEGRPPNRYDVLGGLARLGRLRHERGPGVRALPARGAAQADGGHVARLSTSPNPDARGAPRAVPHSARRTKPQPARLRSGAQGSCPTPAHHDGRAGHCGQGQPAGNAERPRGAEVAVIGC